MSTRTIIEINHDRLSELEEDIAALRALLPSAGVNALKSDMRLTHSVRVLAQRHHSDGVEVKINDYVAYSEPRGKG